VGRPGQGYTLNTFSRYGVSWEPVERDFIPPRFGDCIGWRQPGEGRLRVQTAGSWFGLLDVIDETPADQIRVHDAVQEVGGHRCRLVEVEGGRDRLWFSPDLGYCLVRREWRPKSDTERVFEYTNSDFKLVAPSVWLPHTCSCEVRPLGPQRKPQSYRLDVVRVAVNDDVPGDLFVPRFLAGSLVFGTSGVLEQAVPGGSELLDQWVAVLLTDYPPSPSRHADLRGWWVMTTGTVAAALGLLLSAGRPRRPGQAPAPGERATGIESLSAGEQTRQENEIRAQSGDGATI
jgi:hypothetical protein